MDNYTLYMHVVPNGKKYIGITSKDPVKRWNGGSGYNSNEDFHRDIKKYGWGNIKHKILQKNMSKEEAEYWEVELIAKYHTMDPKKGYNRNSGGFHHGEVSEITRAKISKNTTIHNRASCVCIETGEEYESMAEAARVLGLKRSKINASCLTDGRQSVKGLHFIYGNVEKRKEDANMARQKVMRESFSWDWEW